MSKFSYQVAVVTGASSGIGYEICMDLSRKGVAVIATGRNPLALEKLKASAPTLINTVSGDLNEPSTRDQLVEIAQRQPQERPLTMALVNNAGIIVRKPFTETSYDEWQQQWQTNMMAAVELTRGMLPLMGAGSCILNIASTLGLRPIPNTLGYSATKAAMINWSQGLALELASQNIRVNCINPGIVETPIHSRDGQSLSPKDLEQMHQAHPLGRMGLPKDISKAALFLLSSDSNWITGSVLNVDGGISLL